MADITTGQDTDVLSMPTGSSAAQVQGTVAHDGADGQNPVKVGYKAVAHGTNPTGVSASGDRVDSLANVAGIPFVLGGHPNVVSSVWQFTSAQTNVKLITVLGGTKIIITQVQILVSAATNVNVGVRLGLAQSTLPTLTANSATPAANEVAGHPGIAPGSGIVVGSGSGILNEGADGDDLIITCDAASSGALRIIVKYFTIET